MSTAGQLTERTKKELADMARKRGVRGWDAMNKDDLVKAIARQAKKKTADSARMVVKSVAVKTANKSTTSKSPKRPLPAKPAAKLPLKPAAKAANKITKPSRPVAPTVKVLPQTNGTPRHTQNGPATLKVATASNPIKLAVPTKPAVPAKPTPSPPVVKATLAPVPTAAVTKPDALKTTPAKPAPLPVPAGARDTAKDQPPAKPVVTGPTKDRIIMAVHDPYWLHVYWELSVASVQRAEAALKQDWYGAKLIIRLYDVTSQDTTSTSETPIRDIPIETDGSNWYINVQQPPRQYRADLGYLSRRGMLFVLARSNVVTPPKAGSSEAIDAGWNMDTKKAERILAMSTGFESAGNPDLREVFEERLERSLGAPKEIGFGSGATPPGSLKKFFFEIDAKLVVMGRTDPSAHLTLGNDPIKLNPDGTFYMSFSLPDSRQIIPAVATSSDGVEERTIVLAVERNTKYLDPMIHDQMNEI